jgi:hypothetical protein
MVTLRVIAQVVSTAALQTKLERSVGQNINQICNTGFTSPSENHCAHYVCHILDLQYGLVCGSMAWATRGQGATLRVNELYNALDDTGRWDARPATEGGKFIFVIRAAHMRTAKPSTASAM